MPEKTVREITENYFFSYAGSRDEKVIDRYLSAIREHLKGKMPKDKTKYECEGYGYYNQALSDIDEMLDKEMR